MFKKDYLTSCSHDGKQMTGRRDGSAVKALATNTDDQSAPQDPDGGKRELTP